MIKTIDGKLHYYDRNGAEIHEGDRIRWASGRIQEVYLTEDGELGTDATNPLWVESGRAVPCEYGIYSFSETDMERVTLCGSRTEEECRKPIYKVPVYWEMYGFMEVEANSPEEAWQKAEEEKDDCGLPHPANYVDESFHIDHEAWPFRADGKPDGAPV